jgi:hypothetical protein
MYDTRAKGPDGICGDVQRRMVGSQVGHTRLTVFRDCIALPINITDRTITEATWDLANDCSWRLGDRGHSVPMSDILIAADNQSIGVLIDHQQNVTIRNGKIQGFQQAIVFDDHTKRITWPGNDLASSNVAVQSVEALKEAPVDAEKKKRTQATSEQPKSTPSASPTPEISGGFLDRYDATKSSPQASLRFPRCIRNRRSI